MRLERFGLEFKTVDPPDDDESDKDKSEGVFSGYASTWDQDLYDDVIVKGAFADTLKNDFKENGAGIPIHWQHEDSTPNSIIGETLSAVEDDKGLLITARLDTSIPEGQRAYELLQRGLIHQMSIGYIPQETAFVAENEAKDPWDGHREIRTLKLFEISLVQVAANQAAEVIEVKAGRAISAANESKLRKAYEQLGAVLDSISETPTGSDDDDSDSTDSDGDSGDDSDSESDSGPSDSGSDKGTKDFDPAWAKEYQEISDFLSLATTERSV